MEFVEKSTKTDNLLRGKIKISKSAVTDALLKLKTAEMQYCIFEQEYNEKKNTLWVETCWNKINSERRDEGLDSLSSDTKKRAYIEYMCAEEKKHMNITKVDCEVQKRIYDLFVKYYMLQEGVK